jgi:hypothetical protein
MSQQFGIMIMIDVKSAIKTKNLREHTYLIDNMKDFGSQNEGTNDLISKVNGTYWANGNQAGEEVINWLAVDINAMPRTVQKPSYYSYSNIEAIQNFILNEVLNVDKPEGDGAELDKPVTIEMTQAGYKKLINKLKEVAQSMQGKFLKPSKPGENIDAVMPLETLTGNTDDKTEAQLIQENNYINLPPIITNITGEAVDLGIIFPAQYGSPNFNTRGWYWCATVSTAKAGKYSYTVHVVLFEAVLNNKGEVTWKPVRMSFESHILISKDPMKNGFTGAGQSYLPIY